MKVWIVDAFADRPFQGNPAAVLIVDQFFHCQQIAAEMNLSETAFVRALHDNHYQLKWFTPIVEVDLCGHATLAAAHVLKKKEVFFETRSGILRVFKAEHGYTLDFPLQKVGEQITSAAIERNFPNGLAYKALDDVIVALNTPEEVMNFRPNFEELSKIECLGVIITSKGHGPYDFISRYFGPREGINEDPVTGSAHCKLADFWHKRLGKMTFFAYQASKRGGEIHLSIHGERVHLSGKAVTILEGEFSC